MYIILESSELQPGFYGSRDSCNRSRLLARPRYNPWLVAFTVTLATFMEVLDTSDRQRAALPHIAGTFGASTNEATWVLTSYSGVERNRATDQRVAGDARWAQEILYVLRGAVRGQQLSLRFGPDSGNAGLFPCPAGRRRRGTYSPASRRFSPTRSPPSSAAWRSPFTPWRWCSRRRSAPRSADTLPINYSWRWIFYINVPISILSLFSDVSHRRGSTVPGAGK